MRPFVLGLALLIGLTSSATAAKVEIRVQRDKQFSFKGIKTWDWHPDGAGDVKMMTNTFDDPKRIHEQLDPVITAAVEKELAARGFTRSTGGGSDLLVNYYVLVMPSSASTSVGQFLPGVNEYGLPPFPASTTYLRAFEKGSLVLDLVAPAQKSVVWRGVAQAEVNRELTPEERRARIGKIVADILKKLPRE